MLIGSTISELLVIAAAGASGWLAGLASAWLTVYVSRLDCVPSRLSRSFLVRDPLLQSAVAATWMILATGGLSWQTGAAGVVGVPLVQAAVTDLRHGYVYTVVVACGVAVSIALTPIAHQTSPWAGLSGAAVGLVSMSLLRRLGGMAYPGASMGRGDVLIGAMVGAAAGPEVFAALAAGLVLNGLLGLYVLRAKRSTLASMPYAPGLCVGGLISLVLR